MLVEKIGVEGESRPTDPAQQCSAASAHWTKAYPTRAVLEFSRDRKSMSTLCGLSAGGGGGGKSPARGRSPAKSPGRSKSPAKAKSPARAKSPAKKTGGDATDANMLYVKGAPESVVARCNYARLANGTKVAMSEKDRAAVLKTVAEMAARPLRVLAMAVKEDVGPLATYDGPAHPSQKLLTNPAKFGELEDDLVFVGLCGIKDPARPEVKPAIQECYTGRTRGPIWHIHYGPAHIPRI